MRLTPPPTRLGRVPDGVSLSDLTDRTPGLPYWDAEGALVIPFDIEPTPAEQAAIRRRLLTRDAAHEAQVKAMQDALAGLGQTANTPTEIVNALRLLLRAELGPLAPPTE